jgi:hypothetical protein
MGLRKFHLSATLTCRLIRRLDRSILNLGNRHLYVKPRKDVC